MKLFQAPRGKEDGERPPVQIQGDRGRTLVSRALSMQSRISNLLAFGLMGAIGAGALIWYYGSAVSRPERARRSAQAAQVGHTADEMPLPSLGRIDAPVLASPAAGQGSVAPASPSAASTPVTASAPMRDQRAESALPPGTALPEPVQAVPLAAAGTVAVAPLPSPGTVAVEPVAQGGASPHRSTIERELSGKVFDAGSAPVREDSVATGLSARMDEGIDAGGGTTGAISGAGAGADALAGLLRAPVVPAVQARVLPTQRLLLPQGAFIDCTLETAIDSTLPGMTTCVTATDTFSADGKVVLLERGTKLVGETRGEVQQGAARVFVLWTQARTPTGVVVPLDSPGTDELGRSGLPGQVDRHFWDRFGAAILISVIDGAVQAAVQSSAGSGGTVVVNPSASADVLTEVLKSTVNIAPSVLKRNGDRIQVLVARDVDFTHVYQLRHVAAQR